MKNKRIFAAVLLIIGVVFIASCTKTVDETVQKSGSPNILLIIADDFGKDAIKGYMEGSIKPNTPNIDGIRSRGMLFNNFWVNPTCTPSRSAIITGKYGFRTGVKAVGDALGTSETVLQKYISDQTAGKYATAVVGKWHLAGNNGSFNPESLGIDYYAGLLRGSLDDYYNWQLTEDGTGSLQTGYATEVFTNLAIDWVKEQTKPWFMWLAYNAPHTPFHVPPSEMHQQGVLPEYTTGADPLPYYMAAIEAMDYQIGRLLSSISKEELDNTVIIFMGDNGTQSQAAQSPYSANKVKSTLYQGGINVPLFISGVGVSRLGSNDNLITGTDLFATIAELAGVNVQEYQDSKSFKSLLSQAGSIRKYQYSELNDGTGDLYAIGNGVYKMIVNSTGSTEFYNLINDPYEQNNLMNGALTATETAAKLQLEAELKAIRQ